PFSIRRLTSDRIFNGKTALRLRATQGRRSKDGRRPSSSSFTRCSLRASMQLARRHLLALAGAVVASFPRAIFAQAYPSRPVRVLVPVAPGGANDTTARLFAQKLSEHLGQQFYVENLPGAGGNLAIGNAARATADGYT